MQRNKEIKLTGKERKKATERNKGKGTKMQVKYRILIENESDDIREALRETTGELVILKGIQKDNMKIKKEERGRGHRYCT